MVMQNRMVKIIHIFMLLVVLTLFTPALTVSGSSLPAPRLNLATYEFLPGPNYTQNDVKAILRISQYDMPVHTVTWKDPQGGTVSCGSYCVTNYEYSPGGGYIIASNWEFYIAGRSLPSGTYTAVVNYCTSKIGPNCISWALWFNATFTIQDVTYRISGNAGTASATLSYFDLTAKTIISDDSGKYTITVPAGWSGTVTPSKSHYIFTPESIPYSNVQEQHGEQNYIAAETYDIYMPLLTK